MYVSNVNIFKNRIVNISLWRITHIIVGPTHGYILISFVSLPSWTVIYFQSCSFLLDVSLSISRKLTIVLNVGRSLSLPSDRQVVAPYSGVLRKTGPRQITIAVSDMSNVEIILDNIDLNVAETQARSVATYMRS